MKIQLIPSWSWVRRQGTACSSCPIAKSLLEPVSNIKADWWQKNVFLFPKKHFYVVRLALEPAIQAYYHEFCNRDCLTSFVNTPDILCYLQAQCDGGYIRWTPDGDWGSHPCCPGWCKRLHLKLVITSLVSVLKGLMIIYLNDLLTDRSFQRLFVYGIQPEDTWKSFQLLFKVTGLKTNSGLFVFV